MATIAFAGALAPARASGDSAIGTFFPLVFFCVLFYFFILRPQRRKKYCYNFPKIDMHRISMEKLGIVDEMVQEIDPVALEGYSYEGAEIVLEDKTSGYVSNLWQMTRMYFSDNQIFVYSCTYNMCTGRVCEECTEEYYYKDIVSISTRTIQNQVTIRHKVFNVSLKVVILNVSGLSFTFSVTGVPNADQIVKGLMQKVREKKMA